MEGEGEAEAGPSLQGECWDLGWLGRGLGSPLRAWQQLTLQMMKCRLREL